MSGPHPVTGPERAELTLMDGVVLVADIYRPTGDGQYPALLMRQPYGRQIASTVVLAHPAWYASHGYVVVIQDARGTGDSGGDFDALVNEAADGAAALDWVAGLPFCNGKIGMYGFSYQGASQYLALAGGGRRPDAIAPHMAPWSLRDHWVFEGNAFRFEHHLAWAQGMAAGKAARLGDAAALSILSGTASSPASRAAYLRSRPDLAHLDRWEADDPAVWNRASPDQALQGQKLDVPVLHVGGWYDYMLGGTLAADAAFAATAPQTTHLVVGPWMHIPWNRSAGADMGEAAELSIDQLQLDFFGHYLKGEGSAPPRHRIFDIGTHAWQTGVIPAAPNVDWFVGSSGLAATLVTDGSIVPQPAETGSDRFVHNPGMPAALIGGPIGTPPGYVDRACADDFADVAVYTTAPFDAATRLYGSPVLALDCEASVAQFDLAATLSLVTAGGAAMVLATRFCRLDQPTRGMARLNFDGICVTLKPGEALRLTVAGAAAPAFTVAYAADPERPLRKLPITVTIHHENTRLSLPLAG